MGSDELKKRRRSHDKYIDRQRAELTTPGLFTQTPTNQPRSCVAAIASGAVVGVGETLVVEAADSTLLARRGNDVVLTFPQPPADVLSAVRSGPGVACGVVQGINTLSRTAEVTIK